METLLKILAAPETHQVALAICKLADHYHKYPPPRRPRYVTARSVVWCGLAETLAWVMRDWQPGALPDERAYQESLDAFLRRRSPGATVLRESPLEGRRPDFIVARTTLFSEERVVVELKAHLTEKSERDRLVGQVGLYYQWDMSVIVVVCGHSDRREVESAREQLQGLQPMLADEKILFVEVPPEVPLRHR